MTHTQRLAPIHPYLFFITRIVIVPELNRVHLARTLKGQHNVLMLDEPTNDLDVNTLRSLEEALAEYEGSMMVISHDRWFLDRLCDSIIAFEGDGSVVYFEGTYGEYERDRKKRLGV